MTAPAVVVRQRQRVRLLEVIRRPSRVTQLEQLLARYRWANAGLRDRLATLEAALGDVETTVDREARVLGHAHPLIVDVRTAVAQVRR